MNNKISILLSSLLLFNTLIVHATDSTNVVRGPQRPLKMGFVLTKGTLYNIQITKSTNHKNFMVTNNLLCPPGYSPDVMIAPISNDYDNKTTHTCPMKAIVLKEPSNMVRQNSSFGYDIHLHEAFADIKYCTTRSINISYTIYCL